MADLDRQTGARLVVAEIHGQGYLQAELSTLLAALADDSLAEPGCVWFRVLRAADPGEFVVASLWVGETELRGHYRTAHYARYRRDVIPLLVRTSDVEIFAVSGSVHALDPDPPDPTLLG